jgi:hypothetical protein
MQAIIITKRSDDYHAHLAPDKRIWGCGRTIDEAIGDLIRAHREAFGIKIQEA